MALDRIRLLCGDSREQIATLEDNSIDACVTDPPYHIGFMNKQWDGGDIAFSVDLWVQVLRVLKPGGHVLAFGGTRTYHRMACAIEDTGFEIRDQIGWVYGSGFPKSHDVSKGIDRAAGAERKQVLVPTKRGNLPEMAGNIALGASGFTDISEPITDAARQWRGWGTALKPAWEPIVLARKPLSEKTVAANVLRWGTGAINVDGCRVETDELKGKVYNNRGANLSWGGTYGKGAVQGNAQGRWPANLIHDGSEEVVGAFPENDSGRASGYDWTPTENQVTSTKVLKTTIKSGVHFGDSGSAARFFYTAKADSDDRLGSKHPTVKPLDLMQYLCRLITPPEGTVLDPFAGTGTTGEAAFREGFKAILIERESGYQNDIRRRMALILSGPDERTRETIKAKDLPYDPGPLFSTSWDQMWSQPFGLTESEQKEIAG